MIVIYTRLRTVLNRCNKKDTERGITLLIFLLMCLAVAIMPSNNGSTLALSSIGSNGHIFSECGIENSMTGATKAISKGSWTIGLVNSKFKYLR